MNTSLPSATLPAPFELRFEDLSRPGHAYAFPCDAGGHVDLDELSERGRERYFYARALVGRDWSHPCVVRTANQGSRSSSRSPS